MSLEENVKEKVLSLGADFAGIAPRSRFEFAPENAQPDKLVPNFHSVVAYGIAMDRGALDAYFSKRSRRPIGLHMQLATDELDHISLRLSRWLERQGFKSVFIAQNGNYHIFRGRPDFSHRHAAVAAGLGRLGLSSNFVHTQFGGAVHLASVITEAVLAPDPMVSDEDIPATSAKPVSISAPFRPSVWREPSPFSWKDENTLTNGSIGYAVVGVVADSPVISIR